MGGAGDQAGPAPQGPSEDPGRLGCCSSPAPGSGGPCSSCSLVHKAAGSAEASRRGGIGPVEALGVTPGKSKGPGQCPWEGPGLERGKILEGCRTVASMCDLEPQSPHA